MTVEQIAKKFRFEPVEDKGTCHHKEVGTDKELQTFLREDYADFVVLSNGSWHYTGYDRFDTFNCYGTSLESLNKFLCKRFNSEACPGCGNMPGDGINPKCHHEDGCEFWRQEE